MPTLTITTTSAQSTRISAAFGKQFGSIDSNGQPRGATTAEVKEEVIRFLRTVVLEHEKQEAANIAEASISPITPT